MSEPPLLLPASASHRLLALIGTTFVLFEIVFLFFYSENFWFDYNVVPWGIPVVLLVAGAAHLFLTFLESNYTTRRFWFFLQGKPLVVYRRWLALSDDGLAYGMKHVLFEAIDEVNLTFFGNLMILSRRTCGPNAERPDILVKFPFAAGWQQDQNRFIEALKSKRPDLKVNTRLEKRLKSKILKGQAYVQLAGALMMAVLLVDLGYSSFYFVDMLKDYYMARVCAIAGKTDEAERYLAKGDLAESHPFQLSYITSRFMTVGASGASLHEARADALWALGKKKEAIASQQQAIVLNPDSLNVCLHQVRFLVDDGQYNEAESRLNEVLDKHKHALLPRLYMLAAVKDVAPERPKELYKSYMKQLSDDVFMDEPIWPPGGETFLHELFHSDDINFVFERLLGIKSPPEKSKG
jgi:tetratricopeptide (TPR) repeat protein